MYAAIRFIFVLKELNSIFIFQAQPFSEISSTLYFTPEWQNIQCNNFENLREKVVNARLNYVHNTTDIVFPSNSEEIIKFCSSQTPLLKVMMQINQNMLEELLEELLSYLTNQNVSIDFSSTHKWLSQWIYSALACLHIPIEPSMHSILREIAKECIELRKKLQCDDYVRVLPLNLIICIVSNNFNQLDLSDNFS